MAKRLPKPFQRPGVDLDLALPAQRRQWRHVLPLELVHGDTIGGFGTVGEVTDLGAGYVRVTNTLTGQRETMPVDRPVYAFTREA